MHRTMPICVTSEIPHAVNKKPQLVKSTIKISVAVRRRHLELVV